MSDSESMATITVRDIDREDHKELRHWCVENETSLNQLMLRLIAEFVGKQSKGRKRAGEK